MLPETNQPEPNVIAFDTAAAHCAAALLSGGRIMARVDPMAKGQAEHLMPMLEDMLVKAGLDWTDLDGIGVGTGPGNFTGIRISVAAARGLALGLGIPAVGVSAFAARAYGCSLPVTAVVPAPRERIYVQDIRADGTSSAPQLLPLDGTVFQHPTTQDITADNLIEAVARIAASQLGEAVARPAPLYVRPADAAPPRDAAPVMLS